MEINKKTQTTEDATTSMVTSKKQITVKEATTSRYSATTTQTTRDATTSMVRATTQTTEGPATAVAISTVKQGRRHRTDFEFIWAINIEAFFYIFINALHAGYRFVLRKVEM